ncbi:MAG: tetratricopeptide repeat protein [Promethearchaeota archaeon]
MLQIMSTINYPPDEIYNPPALEKKNFEHIILWMLFNNEECEWANFTGPPLELSLSTLSKYLSLLKSNEYVEKISKGKYKITNEGKKRYHILSGDLKKKRTLSYPSPVITRRRNYGHWIIWMVYNNNYCVWSDFLDDDSPVKINQSSLSKNMNLLIDKGFIEKDEGKKYRITRSGKLEYSNVLKNYDLDRQSILEEESKRIEEVTKITIKFFEKYEILDENIQFRFLNNVLKLDYTRVESMLTDEEDFDKILLFISMNHPDQFPDFISTEEFSSTFGINESKLGYYLDEIVENQIYPIKFFKLIVSPDIYYYFQEDETLEIMLRAITEDHITKFTYLSKLFSRSINISATVNDILEKSSNLLFDKGLKESLRAFIPDYISYLAYKVEAKGEFVESMDKLEGIVWHDMIDIFNHKASNGQLEAQFEEEIREIDEELEVDPENLDLYNSKIRILIYFEQLDDVLEVLDKMLEVFPDNDKDIKMKKATVLRRLQKVQSGLEVIDELIEDYPEDDVLLSYKAYWLQYLNRKEDSISIIKDLVNRFPDNATYHDTYGEILMNFEDYAMAANEFQKAIDINSSDWYIPQTYIKLGICYKEQKDYKLALEHLKRGIEITDKEVSDPETKHKWLAIANLFVDEIEQLS